MTTTTAAPGVNPFAALNRGTSTQTANEAGSADRFLKLLVTQMQNQDPLNPMDNAQVTSQMAQINTVNGIERLNGTVEGLNTQFAQLQSVAGASLVGRQVSLQGNRLLVEGGKGVGGFDLSGTADQVKVEILNPAGRVVQTLNLGAMNAGRHDFSLINAELADGNSHSFRITATQGSAAVTTTALMRDRVDAVRADGQGLVVETAYNGSVAYRDVKSFN